MGYAEFMGLKMFSFMVLATIGGLSSFVVAPVVLNFMELSGEPGDGLMVQGICLRYLLSWAYPVRLLAAPLRQQAHQADS
jgi:hypothetical protein